MIIIPDRTSDLVREIIAASGGNPAIYSYNNIDDLDYIFQQGTFNQTWEMYKTNNNLSTMPENFNPILLQATNLVDNRDFTGTKSSNNYNTSIPRDGMTCNGNAIPDGSIPNDIYIAHALQVMSLILNPTNFNTSTGGQTVTRSIDGVQAGPVEVQFGSQVSTNEVASRSIRPNELDPHLEAEQILQCYVVGASQGSQLNLAFGVDSPNYFKDIDPFQRW